MELLKRFAMMVARLGQEPAQPACPRYATEHPVAKGISLSARMLEARVGR